MTFPEDLEKLHLNNHSSRIIEQIWSQLSELSKDPLYREGTSRAVWDYGSLIERGIEIGEPEIWWRQAFTKGKGLRDALENKEIEKSLNDEDRSIEVFSCDVKLFVVRNIILIHEYIRTGPLEIFTPPFCGDHPPELGRGATNDK